MLKKYLLKSFEKGVDKSGDIVYTIDVNKREIKERNKTMRKETYTNNLKYIYDADKKNTKYSLNNGESWMNHGDYCECLAKSVLGFEPKKDGNTRADKGHDIPELNASVKSWNCGLSDRKDLKGLGFEEFFERFFADELPNTQYIWVHDYADMVDLYYMNETEMKEFTRFAAKYYDYEQKIRFKLCVNKIINYLEEKVA